MDISQQSEIIHPASMVEDVALTAMLPQDMVVAQQQLIAWVTNKIAIEKADVFELREAADHAKKNKWKSGTFESQHRKAVKRWEYYEKIKAALEAGYYIVPNFPISMFAIKTSRRNVKYLTSTHWRENFQQQASEIPQGEGDYKNPFPVVHQRRSTSSDGKSETTYYPESWDQIEFPVSMAKPVIMEATSRAMALKIFDKIGIMPAAAKEDPVIIGQIFRKSGRSTRTVSFMIAWHLNTNVL